MALLCCNAVQIVSRSENNHVNCVFNQFRFNFVQFFFLFFHGGIFLSECMLHHFLQAFHSVWKQGFDLSTCAPSEEKDVHSVDSCLWLQNEPELFCGHSLLGNIWEVYKVFQRGNNVFFPSQSSSSTTEQCASCGCKST